MDDSSRLRTSRSLSATSDDDRCSRFPTPDPEDVQEFQDLMTTLLPQASALAATASGTVLAKRPLDDQDDENDGSIMENGVKRPMTKAEKQNAKKKRRKEREREAKMDEVVAKREELEKEELAKPIAFRLFSERPVLQVSLLPAAEEYEIPPNPRHVDLEPGAAAKLRKIAAEAAFDASELIAAQHAAPAPHRRRVKAIRTVHAVQTPSAALFVIQAHHSPAEKTGGKSAKPKPGATIPRIDVFDVVSPVPHGKRQRTKRTRREV